MICPMGCKKFENQLKQCLSKHLPINNKESESLKATIYGKPNRKATQVIWSSTFPQQKLNCGRVKHELLRQKTSESSGEAPWFRTNSNWALATEAQVFQQQLENQEEPVSLLAFLAQLLPLLFLPLLHQVSPECATRGWWRQISNMSSSWWCQTFSSNNNTVQYFNNHFFD